MLRRNALPIVLFAVLAVAPVAAVLLGEPHLLGVLTRVVIFALAALSLDLILGQGGLVSFGHAAFMGLGAYTAAILASHGVHDALVQLPAALFVCTLFALATGAICLRTEGVYFIMITLAFAQMAYFFTTSLSAYGGDDGLSLAARTTLLGAPILDAASGLYAVSFSLLLGAYLLTRTVAVSRFGRVLRGIRQNRTRMEAIGFAPVRFQLAAYVLAGCLAGLSGVLLANQVGFVSPSLLSWQRSGELIVMVVLGGLGSLHGAVMGAALYILLEDVLAEVSQHWRIVFGPLLVLVALFARQGIAGLIERRREP
ncbi:branched-chain amino acid ABC transporter permease [Marinivivus vitaminiproducens]|uniref:branched-chain amino acid ABC transporter permease n=1 Tax=Marinivivus vitaminiproducens TaxID=3035935 RepID=UPI0027A64290|nr:branched-chain amino acid ABC transporter permease [Geminicoccaceae bacterium SCSIO 64248]